MEFIKIKYVGDASKVQEDAKVLSKANKKIKKLQNEVLRKEKQLKEKDEALQKVLDDFVEFKCAVDLYMYSLTTNKRVKI